MELMKGGELFDRISNKKVFTECEAAKYTRQVCACILDIVVRNYQSARRHPEGWRGIHKPGKG